MLRRFNASCINNEHNYVGPNAQAALEQSAPLLPAPPLLAQLENAPSRQPPTNSTAACKRQSPSHADSGARRAAAPHSFCGHGRSVPAVEAPGVECASTSSSSTISNWLCDVHASAVVSNIHRSFEHGTIASVPPVRDESPGLYPPGTTTGCIPLSVYVSFTSSCRRRPDWAAGGFSPDATVLAQPFSSPPPHCALHIRMWTMLRSKSRCKSGASHLKVLVFGTPS